MEQTRVGVIIIGLLLVTSMAGLGYWLGMRVEQGATTVTLPSPTPTVQAAAVSPPPTPVSNQPESFSEPTPPPAVVAPKIILEEIPTSVRLGSPLRVRWQIQGFSTGVRGTSTRLLVSVAGTQERVGPWSGSFVLPARFEATVTIQKRGNVLLVAEAMIAGQTLRVERPVTVE